MVGEKFGLLTVLAISNKKISGRRAVECICECGGYKTVRVSELERGHVRSCGCIAATRVKHGLTDTPEYIAWNSMRQRCRDKNTHNYHRYGGRGIKICDRWYNDPVAFVHDMGLRPSPIHSLERLDVDGDYTPENCVWATPEQQATNRSTTVFLEFEGQSYSLTQWANITGIPKKTLFTRIGVLKWDTRRALTEGAVSEFLELHQ